MKSMMFESLESREMFSVAAPVGQPLHSQASPAIHMTPSAKAKAKAPVTLVGSYNGTLTIPQVAHFKSVTLKIKSVSKKNVFAGTLTTTGVSIKVSGVATSTGFTISMTGNHPGGPIQGTGTGTATTGNKTLSISMNFVSGAKTLPGTLALTRA